VAVKLGRGTFFYRFRHLFLLYAQEYKKLLTPEQREQFDKIWGK
jgi:hypothetical protein